MPDGPSSPLNFGAFGGDIPPFAEAVEFFLGKGIMTRAEFNALAAAEKVKAFTAAYVHAADELQVIHDACLKAIESGATLRDFIQATEDILTRPWHRETVFRTNVLSSYGAGHWEQAQDTRSMRPYARYSAVMDGRTRPRHAALHGLIFPLDHPFWQTYWPPWDYNCRCGAFTLSQGEIEAEGMTVSQGVPPAGGPRNNFVSPAAGGKWQPDYTKYAPELASQVRRAVEGQKAIYD
jgi:SPP1 gp7 family putative phage head morphogenesis protein